MRAACLALGRSFQVVRLRSFASSRPFRVVSVPGRSLPRVVVCRSQVDVPDRSCVSSRRPSVVVRPVLRSRRGVVVRPFLRSRPWSSVPQDGTVGRTDVNASALPRWNIFPSTYEEARGGKAVLGN